MIRALLILSLLVSCTADTSSPLSTAPSDDPADYDVDTSVQYSLKVGEPRWIVPSESLAGIVDVGASNANEDIIFFEDRLFLAWRTSPIHWANAQTQLIIVSSTDQGKTWELEHTIDLQTDLREPRFFAFNGKLDLIFFEAGSTPSSFEPKRMLRTRRLSKGVWDENRQFGENKEVPWAVKTRQGIGYLTSYIGDHYFESPEGALNVLFRQTTDGENWSLVDGKSTVYQGGVSEAAFEFDADGSIWIVTRNEDGDDTGFGSHVCTAKAGALGTWTCPDKSDPERYDSPHLFRHGDDIYLVARRDVGGPYDQGDASLTVAEQRSKYLLDYSLRPKRSAIYRIDKAAQKVVHVQDIPGVGDTAFPAVIQVSAHRFLLANYTSPVEYEDWSWLQGQTSNEGTKIYFVDVSFEPTN
jgi:hypothetical protein